MSQYDKIKTATDLVREVRMNGLSTKQEDLNRAADIIGRSSIEELDMLANDIGRDNANGEPDPKGTFSSGRIATQDTFYSIVSHIWHWDDVTRFWNKHTNPDHEKLADLRNAIALRDDDLDKASKKLKACEEREEQEHEMRLSCERELMKANEQINQLLAELHDRDMTIIELKAKLYDLITEKEERK